MKHMDMVTKHMIHFWASARVLLSLEAKALPKNWHAVFTPKSTHGKAERLCDPQGIVTNKPCTDDLTPTGPDEKEINKSSNESRKPGCSSQ